MIRKVALLALAAFLVFYVATKPAAAAHTAQHLAASLGHVASGLADFIGQLTK